MRWLCAVVGPVGQDTACAAEDLAGRGDTERTCGPPGTGRGGLVGVAAEEVSPCRPASTASCRTLEGEEDPAKPQTTTLALQTDMTTQTNTRAPVLSRLLCLSLSGVHSFSPSTSGCRHGADGKATGLTR